MTPTARRPLPSLLLPLLIGALAAPAFADGTAPTPAPPPDPERVRWVAEHAVAVRSIDPADEDFSDLMPLVQAIGKARVVQLGEATHGDGATFLAKGRLIRFLHQVMGFDVVAWETGLFDVRQMDVALRAGLPSAEAARRGIYPAWHNDESMHALDYARATQATNRPITHVGFDCRVGLSPNRRELFPRMIFAFFDRLDPALLSPAERERFKAVSLAVNTLPMELHYKPEIKQQMELPRRLVETIDRRRADLLVHFPAHEIDFVRRTLVSLLDTERAVSPGTGMSPTPDGYGRDTVMAENLLWWLRGPLTDRKVVVWAHNYHVMNSSYLGTPETDAARPLGGPMGRFLKAELGPELYTIGFTAHGGAYYDGEEEGNEKAVAVTPGALEKLLHAAGRPFLFLDLARLPADHWLRAPWTASFYMNEPSESTWPRVYDGVFFLDEQKPATPLAE